METVRRWIPFVAAVLVGAALRGWQLAPQILVDDEWHSLDRDLRLAYWVPSVAYFAIQATIGLSEWMIRGFFWGFGIFLTAALPAVARPFVGWKAAAVFCWLLAISPLLIYYSRFARPYALAALFSLVAVVWFLEWWQSRRAGFAAAYVVAAMVALAMHPLMAPFVLSPFVIRLAALMATPGRRLQDLKRLVAIGSLTLAGAVLSVAPLFYDPALAFNTAGVSSRELGTLVEVCGTYFGTRGLMVLPMAVFACTGLVSLLRREPALGRHLLLASLLQIGSIFITAPTGASAAFIFARYTIPVLPFVLLLAAIGIAAVASGIAARLRSDLASWVHVLMPGLVLVALLTGGPLPGSYSRPSSWFTTEMHLKLDHQMYEFYRQSVHGVSPFYLELGEAEPASLTVIEAPWYSEAHRNPYPFYQAVHRQRVLIGFPGPGFDYLWRETTESLFSSHRFVSLANAGDLAARGDFLVIHKDLAAEMTPLIANEAFDKPAPWKNRLEPMIDAARDRFGEAFYEDAGLVVFRLGAP